MNTIANPLTCPASKCLMRTLPKEVEGKLKICLYGVGVCGDDLSTFTCVGIHPGRVEPTSPIELITSRTEALQARRFCASSLETFTQSFLHRVWLKTRGPKRGSRSALTVVSHVFSWPFLAGVGRSRSLISSLSGRLANQTEPSLHELCWYTCKAEAATHFHG